MSDRRIQAGLGLLYLLGGLILAEQVSELLVTLSPMKPDSAPWRFGAVGVTLGRTSVFLIADALIGLAAFGRRDWRFVRVWGILHLALGVALVVVVGGFALDILTVRAAVAKTARDNVALTSTRAVLVGISLAIFALWSGAKMARFGRIKHSADAPPVLFGPSASEPR